MSNPTVTAGEIVNLDAIGVVTRVHTCNFVDYYYLYQAQPNAALGYQLLHHDGVRTEHHTCDTVRRNVEAGKLIKFGNIIHCDFYLSGTDVLDVTNTANDDGWFTGVSPKDVHVMRTENGLELVPRVVRTPRAWLTGFLSNMEAFVGYNGDVNKLVLVKRLLSEALISDGIAGDDLIEVPRWIFTLLQDYLDMLKSHHRGMYFHTLALIDEVAMPISRLSGMLYPFLRQSAVSTV